MKTLIFNDHMCPPPPPPPPPSLSHFIFIIRIVNGDTVTLAGVCHLHLVPIQATPPILPTITFPLRTFCVERYATLSFLEQLELKSLMYRVEAYKGPQNKPCNLPLLHQAGLPNEILGVECSVTEHFVSKAIGDNAKFGSVGENEIEGLVEMYCREHANVGGCIVQSTHQPPSSLYRRCPCWLGRGCSRALQHDFQWRWCTMLGRC